MISCWPNSWLYLFFSSSKLAAARGTIIPGRLQRSALHAVRVIGCDGSGSMLDVITALEWVHAHAQPPAVVLMSLGGPAAQVFDDACQSLVDVGISVVVAAGNDGAGDSPLCHRVLWLVRSDMHVQLLASMRG
jgi:subtilisin family serine protease